MPTVKPGYKGDDTWTKICDFSQHLRGKLRSLFPDPSAKSSSDFRHPAEDFVDHILGEAWWAKSELHFLKFQSIKQEIRSERRDLLKLLYKTGDRLRSLSPDFDRLLGINADPLGLADKIEELIGCVEGAELLINTMPDQESRIQKQHSIAVEFAVRILRVLMEYDIQPAATASTYIRKKIDVTEIARTGSKGDTRYLSVAIQILKLVGDDMGLVRSEETWRDIIQEAKEMVPDFR